MDGGGGSGSSGSAAGAGALAWALGLAAGAEDGRAGCWHAAPTRTAKDIAHKSLILAQDMVRRPCILPRRSHPLSYNILHRNV
jgi:hypothetical protein